MAAVFKHYCEYVSDAFIGARMYDLGAYPGVIESDKPAEKVLGEVYRISDSEQLLPELDRYEGCSSENIEPHEYYRKKILIRCLNGDEVTAWIYLYNHSVRASKLIVSGDYIRHIQGLSK